jgi:hypothetical protein
LGVVLILLAQAVVPVVLGATVWAQAPPTFSKAFTPDTIGPGSVSTLRFDIANVVAVNPVTDLAFTDTLPTGVTIATPANAATTCPDATLTALAGGSTISLSGGRLIPSASCTVLVDVTSSTATTHTNVSGDLTSSAGNSGPATDDLIVTTGLPGFSKSFAPGSIFWGGRSTLVFTIDNTANAGFAAYLAFTDNLPAGMVIASPSNASTDCTTGMFGAPVLTAVAGTSLVSLSNGDVAALSDCTVTVDVTAIGSGQLINTTSELNSHLGSSGKATAALQITAPNLLLVKSFTDDPVPAGRAVTLEFSIFNWDRNSPVTNLTFSDDLDAVLSGLAATGLPLNDVCGAGSQISGAGLLTLTGGNLPPEGSCTFSVSVQLPSGAATGTYVNTTAAIEGDVGGSPVTGNAATDLLFVAPVPILTKTFASDTIAAGDAVDVTFTIENTSLSSSATSIAFTDVLADFIPGVVVSNLPADGFCGAGSTLTEVAGTLTMAGGSLAAGDSCTFGATFEIPATTSSGTYSNVTSDITAVIDGTPTLGDPGSDDLMVVGGVVLTKDFTDDPVAPGDAVVLEFALEHSTDGLTTATGISFGDNLDAALSGLAATGLPINDICGPGSQLSGASTLSFTGGSLEPGTSCTFSVTLQVPATGTHGDYTNTTSNVSATVSGLPTTGNAASAVLQVRELTLTKSFIDDPVLPGDTVILEFTLNNVNSASSATNIVFTDDVAAMLAGTTILTSLPINDVCGAGSSLLGAGSTLILSNGSVGPVGSCTFSVELQVPGGAAVGQYNNATSTVSAQLGGSPITANAAIDTLTVVTLEPPGFNKSFAPDTITEGGISTLSFAIDNTPASSSASSLSFIDTLPSGMLIADPPNASTTCTGGTLTAVAGTDSISYSGGAVAGGSDCTVQADVTSSAEGVYLNTSGDLTSSLGDSGTASDTLTVSRPTALGLMRLAARTDSVIWLAVGLGLVVLSAAGAYAGRRRR